MQKVPVVLYIAHLLIRLVAVEVALMVMVVAQHLLQVKLVKGMEPVVLVAVSVQAITMAVLDIVALYILEKW